jgi:hypothetical protein
LFDRNWKTIAENLATVPDLNDGQDVIHKIQKALKVQEISDPLWKSSHRVVSQKLVAMKGLL